jgi:hypothetical protein
MRRRLLLALFLTATSAWAEAPKPEVPAAEQRAVQKFGVDHPDCLGWTDGCMICTPKVCSTPGIACTPHEPICTAQAAPPEAPKPAEQPPVAPPAEKP